MKRVYWMFLVCIGVQSVHADISFRSVAQWGGGGVAVAGILATVLTTVRAHKIRREVERLKKQKVKTDSPDHVFKRQLRIHKAESDLDDVKFYRALSIAALATGAGVLGGGLFWPREKEAAKKSLSSQGEKPTPAQKAEQVSSVVTVGDRIQGVSIALTNDSYIAGEAFPVVSVFRGRSNRLQANLEKRKVAFDAEGSALSHFRAQSILNGLCVPADFFYIVAVPYDGSCGVSSQLLARRPRSADVPRYFEAKAAEINAYRQELCTKMEELALQELGSLPPELSVYEHRVSLVHRGEGNTPLEISAAQMLHQSYLADLFSRLGDVYSPEWRSHILIGFLRNDERLRDTFYQVLSVNDSIRKDLLTQQCFKNSGASTSDVLDLCCSVAKALLGDVEDALEKAVPLSMFYSRCLALYKGIVGHRVESKADSGRAYPVENTYWLTSLEFKLLAEMDRRPVICWEPGGRRMWRFREMIGSNHWKGSFGECIHVANTCEGSHWQPLIMTPAAELLDSSPLGEVGAGAAAGSA